MYALNNYLRGPYVTCEDCRTAARAILDDLATSGGGYQEMLSNHIDLQSGWLSVDVINAVGAANFNLHIEERPRSFDAFDSNGHRAALINWNSQHWTLLERASRSDTWLHTNSILGDGFRHGSRECSAEEVRRIVDEICEVYGSAALHSVTDAQPG